MLPVNGYVITTDMTCDLPLDYAKEKQLDLAPLGVTIKGKNIKGQELFEIDFQKFYDDMRKGELAQTSALSPFDAQEIFEGYLSKGINVIHISFSSALSASYDNASSAMQELLVKYPDSKGVVIDSLCASLGLGLLVVKAIDKMESLDFDQMVAWIQETKFNVCHYFTPNDLFHLHRGGRVSRTSAIMGSLLGVKPVLHVDDNGKLVPVAKVRGRKQALDTLVKLILERAEGVENDIVAISHADCMEDAEYIKNQIQEKTGIEKFIIYSIGPVIGVHSGPSTIAVFMMGNSR